MDNIIQFKLPEPTKLDYEIMTTSIMYLVHERLYTIKSDQQTLDNTFIYKLKYEMKQLMDII